MIFTDGSFPDIGARTGSWSLLLVDSEPVQGALVKGHSAREDLCEPVGVLEQLQTSEFNCISTEFRPMPTQLITRLEIECSSALD